MPLDHLQTFLFRHKPVQLSRQCLPGINYLSHFQAISSPQEVCMVLQAKQKGLGLLVLVSWVVGFLESLT